ncbi:MAG: phosphocholine cytidylyltransferase family protein [Candidatus Rokubacteria bacterium]|nr:phosphocholine cytidylyltransferase family protein [Candidatus Rokubacteria bacterium]
MKAVILAAGVGQRLAPLTDGRPKCLLPVGGRSLLERMLDALEAVGFREALVVVGHCKEQIRERVASRAGTLGVRCVENPDYTKGSILSLWSALEALRGDLLILDADVLFPVELLRRLIHAPAPSALLLDRAFTETGEEVKLYARGPRVVAMGKKITPPPHDVVGEGVGFFKCAGSHRETLQACVEEVRRAAGDGIEYEDALDQLLRRVEVGWADVTGLAWTEVDFPEDLRRAEREVLPRIEATAR